MQPAILIIANLFALTFALFLCEYLWKRGFFKGEESRKAMHISGGLFVATWPLYLNWTQIKLLLIFTIFLVIFVRYIGWFKSFYDIKRSSWGDLIYIITLAAISMFNPPVLLFEAVVLNIALADGFAALVGSHLGNNNSYKVFGHTKSVAGSLAFFITSLAIMFGLFWFGDLAVQAPFYFLIVVSIAATAAENLGVLGLDNALVALVVGTLLYGFNLV